LPTFKNHNLVYDTLSRRLQLQFRLQENTENDEKLNEIYPKLFISVECIANNRAENIEDWENLIKTYQCDFPLNEVPYDSDKQKEKYKLTIDHAFSDNNNRYIHVRAHLVYLRDDNVLNPGEWCDERFYMLEPEQHSIPVNLQFDYKEITTANLEPLTIENLKTFVTENYDCKLKENEILNIDIVSLNDKQTIIHSNIQSDDVFLQLQNIDELLFQMTKIPDRIIIKTQTKNEKKKQMIMKPENNHYTLKSLTALIKEKYKLTNDNIVIYGKDGVVITKDETMLQFFMSGGDSISFDVFD